jgi:hypothetical protein
MGHIKRRTKMEYLYETAQQSWEAELEINWDEADFETMESCERMANRIRIRDLAAMLGISTILAERWLEEAEEER